MSGEIKFKTGGFPPAGARGTSKWEGLYAELDKIELNVWARTTLPDKKTAKNAVVNARKYLKPRKIKVVSALEENVDGGVVLWIKKLDQMA